MVPSRLERTVFFLDRRMAPSIWMRQRSLRMSGAKRPAVGNSCVLLATTIAKNVMKGHTQVPFLRETGKPEVIKLADL